MKTSTWLLQLGFSSYLLLIMATTSIQGCGKQAPPNFAVPVYKPVNEETSDGRNLEDHLDNFTKDRWKSALREARSIRRYYDLQGEDLEYEKSIADQPDKDGSLHHGDIPVEGSSTHSNDGPWVEELDEALLTYSDDDHWEEGRDKSYIEEVKTYINNTNDDKTEQIITGDESLEDEANLQSHIASDSNKNTDQIPVHHDYIPEAPSEQINSADSNEKTVKIPSIHHNSLAKTPSSQLSSAYSNEKTNNIEHSSENAKVAVESQTKVFSSNLQTSPHPARNFSIQSLQDHLAHLTQFINSLFSWKHLNELSSHTQEDEDHVRVILVKNNDVEVTQEPHLHSYTMKGMDTYQLLTLLFILLFILILSIYFIRRMFCLSGHGYQLVDPRSRGHQSRLELCRPDDLHVLIDHTDDNKKKHQCDTDNYYYAAV